MSPPIPKDWWLAAALTGAALPAAMAQTGAATVPQAGVVTAVAPNASVTVNDQIMVVGSDVRPGQHLRTGANGQMHILFMDQSALTLGSDSELTIDEFRYDPATKQGKIRLGLIKGVARVVGGQISKTTGTVISTPQGKVEILGGITLVETNRQTSNATFLFGQSMRTTDNQGNTQTVSRPGFGMSMGGSGVTTPQRVPASQLSQTLAAMETRGGSQSSGTGGAIVAPNSGAPSGSGVLLSTGGKPVNQLSDDRVEAAVDVVRDNTVSLTLQNILGTKQSPNQS